MTKSPYQGLPRDRFWRFGVASAASAAPPGIYKPKWLISQTEKVATAGSCFAQHVGRQLKANGFALMDVEPPPPGLHPAQHIKFGYSIYSGRYGNIYTVRQLLQLASEAFGEFEPADVVWTKGDLFFDALRPGVEPDGLGSAEEVLAHRAYHLARVRELFLTMDVFIFTLGLTESWEHLASGTSYPTAPGTIAGSFDETVYGFRNLTFNEIVADFVAFKNLLEKKREGRPCRFLLTVSPVPLAATASGQHVLPATMLSKALLRGAAGELVATFPDVDYYPSFEIVASPWAVDDFFESDRRDVSARGVALAMQTFMVEHLPNETAAAEPVEEHLPAEIPKSEIKDDEMTVVCEEMLLQKFAEAG